MKLPFAGLALAVTMTALPAYAVEQSARLSVPGMTCASCPFVIEAAIAGVDGVLDVRADASTKEAWVVYDDAITSIDDIQFATLEAGYEATLIETDS